LVACGFIAGCAEIHDVTVSVEVSGVLRAWLYGEDEAMYVHVVVEDRAFYQESGQDRLYYRTPGANNPHFRTCSDGPSQTPVHATFQYSAEGCAEPSYAYVWVEMVRDTACVEDDVRGFDSLFFDVHDAMWPPASVQTHVNAIRVPLWDDPADRPRACAWESSDRVDLVLDSNFNPCAGSKEVFMYEGGNRVCWKEEPEADECDYETCSRTCNDQNPSYDLPTVDQYRALLGGCATTEDGAVQCHGCGIGESCMHNSVPCTSLLVSDEGRYWASEDENLIAYTADLCTGTIEPSARTSMNGARCVRSYP